MENYRKEAGNWYKNYSKKRAKINKIVNSIIKLTKKDYKKWLVIDTKNYLKKKTIRKENTPKIDTEICLKKKNKK